MDRRICNAIKAYRLANNPAFKELWAKIAFSLVKEREACGQ